jgi:PKD repeat protein
MHSDSKLHFRVFDNIGLYLKRSIVLICFITISGVILLFTGCKKDKTTADFLVSSDTAGIGDTVYFTNNSSNATYYQWTFGDGSAAVTEHAAHAYLESGDYTVTLVAIGDKSSGTASKEIRVVGERNIHEGEGIGNFSLDNTWVVINNQFAEEDSIHSIEYIEGYYYHTIYYFNVGLAFCFINLSDSLVNNNDIVVEILAMEPFEGYTTKGITFGDDISTAESVYGTVSDSYEGTYYIFYYYKSGIEFWTLTTSSLINIIGVYSPIIISSSNINNNASYNPEALHNMTQNFINRSLNLSVKQTP